MHNFTPTPDEFEGRIPILFFGNFPPPFGGLPSHFQFLTPRLIQEGFAPIVLVTQSEDYSVWNQKGALVLRIPDDPETLAKETSELRERITPNQAAEITEIASKMAWRVIADRYWGNVGFADRLIRRYNIRLIHTYHVAHRSIVALALKSVHNLPAYLTFFGEVISQFGPDESRRNSLRWMLGSFDQLFSTSNHCARGVEMVGLPLESVRVIPYGVDMGFFHRVDPSPIIHRHQLEGKKVILFQGRISTEKGPQILLESLPRIIADIPEAIVLYVGPDELPDFGLSNLSTELRARMGELGLENHVRLVGSVPFEELPMYYSAAQVLAFPSTTDRECMGLAIKQAMSCKLPVVVAMSGGATEAVADGVSGFCCAPNDSDDLAKALIKVLQAKNWEKMREAGYIRAQKLYNQEKMLIDLLPFYQRAPSYPVHTIDMAT
jgi:glycosyltransferase involved in cell wall biosynthesis